VFLDKGSVEWNKDGIKTPISMVRWLEQKIEKEYQGFRGQFVRETMESRESMDSMMRDSMVSQGECDVSMLSYN